MIKVSIQSIDLDSQPHPKRQRNPPKNDFLSGPGIPGISEAPHIFVFKLESTVFAQERHQEIDI